MSDLDEIAKATRLHPSSAGSRQSGNGVGERSSGGVAMKFFSVLVLLAGIAGTLYLAFRQVRIDTGWSVSIVRPSEPRTVPIDPPSAKSAVVDAATPANVAANKDQERQAEWQRAAPFESNAPIIENAIGRPLFEVAPKALSSQTRFEVLHYKGAENLDAPWFAVNVFNCDVAGFNLTDGLISEIKLFFKSPTSTRMNRIEKLLASSECVNVTVRHVDLPEKNGYPSVTISFRADPVEWYLSRHDAKRAVVSAMRSRKFVVGMNEDEMQVIGDGPGRYRAVFATRFQSGATSGSMSIDEALLKTGFGMGLADNHQEKIFAANSKAQAIQRADEFASETDAIQVKSVERIGPSAE